MMISTDTTALCRGYPSTNLQHRTYPFLGLVFEFFKKLTESKVRDLFTPKSFHTVEVQVFKEEYIKVATQVYCKFPMMIRSLIRSFLMNTRNILAFSLLIVIPYLIEYFS